MATHETPDSHLEPAAREAAAREIPSLLDSPKPGDVAKPLPTRSGPPQPALSAKANRFWGAGLPGSAGRGQITASPPRASLELPALLAEEYGVLRDVGDVTKPRVARVAVTAPLAREYGVLRDVGTADLAKPRGVAVAVRMVHHHGLLHGVTMLDPVRDTPAAEAVAAQAIAVLREAAH
ncbi:hypothetical protein AB0K15_05200 [Amycolatopsis sp. NPDC049253]|uniref:hypothetical protein n=1 Tax=Amycolatopsis sp. NPDC049253 TaxID=3155274 RepID=UPI0034185C0F